MSSLPSSGSLPRTPSTSGSAVAGGASGNENSKNQIEAFISYCTMIVDPESRDENKLKAAQAISEDLEGIIQSTQYAAFLDKALVCFLKLLNDGEPQFIAEHNMQQLRKLLLEIIHRFPSNELLKPYLNQILPTCFELIQKDNEENVMVALRIIIDLYKTFRPHYNKECEAQIKEFITSIKTMYNNLPTHMNKIFDAKPLKVKDMSEIDQTALLAETFTMTLIQTEKKQSDGYITYNLIPKATLSLKVLTELPIIVVLMLQLYKEHVYQEVVLFIPLIIKTINLQPPSNETVNKEIYVDFTAAQIKILSFLAYIIKTFQEHVVTQADQLMQGILLMLETCPSQVTHLRKELLIASKHILQLELRVHCIPHIHKLFDEELLFGTGWTAYDTLRPLAYSTLADLVHHVRNKLNFKNLEAAINLFSKNVHDETLPTAIQTMSCKLLLNLVDCVVRNTANEPDLKKNRDLLMRMLQVFVDKFKRIAKYQVPYLKQKYAEKEATAAAAAEKATNNSTEGGSQDVKTEDTKDTPSTATQESGESRFKDLKLGAIPNVVHNYLLADCKALVKTLVSSVKTITWGCTNVKHLNDLNAQDKIFQPKEILIYIRFVKWAMQALDVYTINVPTQSGGANRVNSPTTGRTKEERDVLEHFAGVFPLFHPNNFREIFGTCIDYVVDRIHLNSALQAVANNFLANEITSPGFATILVEYLLKHMEEMGTPVERSSLYLKLFKLVFGSVSLFPPPNEQMLKPHLHQIVNKSMDLAMTAKEPYNYFLLLRALFRSIGGGKHDLLYQEFLPLLPSLLQGLNSLQSGLHKQHMKDLFVELCLTVPVRLSSLLPYLPMLMDPLVSALNGSNTLVSQGLRTLELCVDNLQPDFLYEHIQPVRAELMQALWKTLRNPHESTAQGAFRVLGKFGGGNRKMMIEPQKLEYTVKEASGSCVDVKFLDYDSPIVLPVERVIEVALDALKTSNTDPWYRQQCWEVVRCFLVGSLVQEKDKELYSKLVRHPCFKTNPIQSGDPYKCSDEAARRVHQTALTAMLVAAAIKELSKTVIPTMVAIVRHYTLVTVVQQAGPFNIRNKITGMDTMVLVDALAAVMGHEEKELCKPGNLALALILSVSAEVLGSKERASKLPLMEYISVKMCQLCYQRSWYAKLGGCLAIKALCEQACLKWVLQHQFPFVRAFLYVMMDLTGEVSTGAIDTAKTNLDKMLQLCFSPLLHPNNTPEMIEVQEKSLKEVTQEFVLQIISSNKTVREQSMKSLKNLGELTGRGTTEVMKHQKDKLMEMVPPKKHLLRHQPANVQIGLMEGNTFCTTLDPPIYKLNLDFHEHKVFINELVNIVDSDDTNLRKYSCYKNVTNLVPLRKSALKALSACYYINGLVEKVYRSFYRALRAATNDEIQEAAFESFQYTINKTNFCSETINEATRKQFNMITTQRITLQGVGKLIHFTRLFPQYFSEDLIKTILKQGFTSVRTQEELKISAAILELINTLPCAVARLIEDVIKYVLAAEQSMLIEAGSILRKPMIKFLNRYPTQALRTFFDVKYRGNEQWGRCLEYIIRNEDAKEIRAEIENFGDELLSLVQEGFQTNNHQVQYIAIRMILLIIKKNNGSWLNDKLYLVEALKNIWCSREFQEIHLTPSTVSYNHWKIPRMIVSILLFYFTINTDHINLLFQLTRVFSGRYLSEFQFLRDFLEESVTKTYPIAWKRRAFFELVNLFRNQRKEGKQNEGREQDLNSNVLQYIVIPSLAHSLENGDEAELISKDSIHEDIVSVFIKCIITEGKSTVYSDSLRILLLQLSCLLVDKASSHFQNELNNKQEELRELMTFAWPCLLAKNCVDPSTKYHGHLLLSYIISKFSINRRIVLQVFHSLLKAHALEGKNVVKRALEVLTPAMPNRMEDGNTMLTHWTRKILVEEGHSIAQLTHILQLIVRHAEVYQPVRYHLLSHVTSSMHKLGFSPTSSIEHKKLAVDLSEVCIKWEEKRISNEAAGIVTTPEARIKGRPMNDPKSSAHADTVTYFLIRMCVHIYDPSPVTSSPSQVLALNQAADSVYRRCFGLLKRALEIWPDADPKLVWLEKFYYPADTPPLVYGNVTASIEILTFLVPKLKRESTLPLVKNLSKSGMFSRSMSVSSLKVTKLFNQMMITILSFYGIDEVEEFADCAEKFIMEHVGQLGTPRQGYGPSLYPALLFLKALTTHKSQYTDRIIVPLLKVLQRVSKDHISNIPAPPANTGIVSDAPIPNTSDVLILLLDIFKTRVGQLIVDMRKAFIGTILCGLIEKSPDPKVLKAIVKIVGDWVKHKPQPPHHSSLNSSPNLKEKSILLVKLQQFVEKRFPENADLMAQYLTIINYIYRDEAFRASELAGKLECAFLSGLRCSQPLIRNSFFEVFHESIPRDLNSRLLYIVCSQNWEQIGNYFWIKQCIQLLLIASEEKTLIQNSNSDVILPCVTSVMSLTDQNDSFNLPSIKEEEMDTSTTDNVPSDDLDSMVLGSSSSSSVTKAAQTKGTCMTTLIKTQWKFYSDTQEVYTSQFLTALVQLCFLDTNVAEWMWCQLFPRVWRILSEKQQRNLAKEIPIFVASGIHETQRNYHPSAMQTFMEALCLCQPPIPIRPAVLKHLAKTHNLWHRMALELEDLMLNSPETNRRNLPTDNPILSIENEIRISLQDLYGLMKEDDLWSGMWQTYARWPETKIAMTFEQHGFMDNAMSAYELAMTKIENELGVRSAQQKDNVEIKLVELHWMQCAKELNQWEILKDYGSEPHHGAPHLLVESGWRTPDWVAMKEALQIVEKLSTRETQWKLNLYKGYLAICHEDKQHLAQCEKAVECASALCIREWKRLPHIVSHIHIPYLQAAQQVMELQEAYQMHQGLVNNHPNSLHDMKAIVKTWRNRLPVISDDLSHWSDIFTWRQHHYQFIVDHYTEAGEAHQNNSMLGVHASAQAIIHFGKIARKHNSTSVCLESLGKIHNIPSVPIVDCFQKIRQQVKCYLHKAINNNMGKTELQEGLEVIESTNLRFFTKEMTAEFYALKGVFFSHLGRAEDANKALSVSLQYHDSLNKGWALWGEYLESLFSKDPKNLTVAQNAMVCFLNAAKCDQEPKSRKYLAKIFWLLSYETNPPFLSEALEKYGSHVPQMLWLTWIPQLLTSLVRNEGKTILGLLNQVAKLYPQAVYLPVRTLYLTLRIEQRGKFKREPNNKDQKDGTSTTTDGKDVADTKDKPTGDIRATEPMLRCSRILQIQRDYHPTVLVSLEGIVDQMMWFRENWYEEVLRQLKQALAKCYSLAFENSGNVTEAEITPYTQSFVKKLVSTFGLGVENLNAGGGGSRSNSTQSSGTPSAPNANPSTSGTSQQYTSTGSESLARRAALTFQDPVFHKMKGQFTADFDFDQPGSIKLHNLIHKLKKWVKILEARVKLLPKWFLIEDKCRFLSNFSMSCADVELPGEFLLPKNQQYFIRIARFLPKVDIVQKHGSAPRRLHIRGHNGRVYPYLVVSDSSLSDSRREERVQQLLRMLNIFFTKQKETSRRFIHLYVSKVVPFSPQNRLVEDNLSSLSLMDVYKSRCQAKNLEPDTPITRYYERLAAVQARGAQASHQVLRDIVKEVQSSMVPKNMLTNWAVQTFPNATCYWSFRKMITVQLGVLGLMEYVLHLTRNYPDMLYFHQDTGVINVAYFKFNVDEVKGVLDSSFPVQFRLTPNLAELCTSIGVSGPLTASMMVSARCLSNPSFKLKAILQAVIRDEILAWHKRQESSAEMGKVMAPLEGEALVLRVNKAVSDIWQRIQALAAIDQTESKATQMVRAVLCVDNLCRMDPAWHPWL